jgi:tRNA threonylcarbamoyladenosine biosynthesis protein TsaB
VAEEAQPRVLLLETSGRNGHVALAEGPTLLEQHSLDENRRNGRDLAPAVLSLLQAQQWQPRDINLVLVSRGPGSYTGLRVGVISAKVFAYATSAALLGIDTFHVIAAQAPLDVTALDVLADAQQERIYVQSFIRTIEGWQSTVALAVRPFAQWLAERRPEAWVTGPGLVKWDAKIPANVPRLAQEFRDPQPQSLLEIGLRRWHAGERDHVWELEPLYCRPSSAEEQWQALGR